MRLPSGAPKSGNNRPAKHQFFHQRYGWKIFTRLYKRWNSQQVPSFLKTKIISIDFEVFCHEPYASLFTLLEWIEGINAIITVSRIGWDHDYDSLFLTLRISIQFLRTQLSPLITRRTDYLEMIFDRQYEADKNSLLDSQKLDWFHTLLKDVVVLHSPANTSTKSLCLRKAFSEFEVNVPKELHVRKDTLKIVRHKKPYIFWCTKNFKKKIGINREHRQVSKIKTFEFGQPTRHTLT